MQVGVHHAEDGGIVVHVADSDRNLFKPRQLTCCPAPVAADDLVIAVSIRAAKDRLQHAVLFDAFHQLGHFLVLPHLKRVIRECF